MNSFYPTLHHYSDQAFTDLNGKKLKLSGIEVEKIIPHATFCVEEVACGISLVWEGPFDCSRLTGKGVGGKPTGL